MRMVIENQTFYIQIATGKQDGKEVWKTLFKINKDGDIYSAGDKTIYDV